MRDQIARIIADCPDTSIDKIGDFWRIRVERHCDTGRNGIAVAEALMKRWRWDKSETPVVPPQPLTTPLAPVAPEANYTAIKESLRAAEPEAVDIPMFLQEPVLEPEAPDPRDAEIAALKAALAAKESKDMFDTAQLTDLIRENETHSEAQLRWQSDYNQLMNRIVDPRLPPLSDNERELLNRLQRALYAGRKGAVGII